MSAEKTAHTVSCSSMCEALIGTQTNSSTKRFIYISCVFIRLKLYEVHSSSYYFSHFSYFAIMMMTVMMMMTFACLHLFFFCLNVESFLRQKKIMLMLIANSLSFSLCSLLLISVSSSNIDTILFMMETNFSCCCCCCQCSCLSYSHSIYINWVVCGYIQMNARVWRYVHHHNSSVLYEVNNIKWDFINNILDLWEYSSSYSFVVTHKLKIHHE